MIGIVILNYNNYQDTINCIASLQINCPDENLKIVVIDNGSTNDSIEQISTYFRHKNLPYNYLSNYTDDEKYDEKFILINAKKNLGYARGNNIGINFLIKHNVEAILILNNDIILIENIIETLINDIKKNPDIGLISPLLLKDENQIDYNCCRNSPSTSIFLLESINIPDLKFINNYIQSKLLVLNNNKNLLEKKIIYCDIISGSCILAKTEVWQKLGGFDENTFLYRITSYNVCYTKLLRVLKNC